MPGGSGDDAGWRRPLAAILSRAAAPAKLPLCTTFAKTRIPIIKLSRIIYAVLALLSTTTGQATLLKEPRFCEESHFAAAVGMETLEM